ncbi:tetratricopeptide repeat protein [Spirulina sp. 06S082]|uniref:tetratricopeptide repeat protein n=1 Tax=Spirulina sp. 06S082 TaxID=3110248 RepID=UPI002B212CDD|nr:tetratricopeptide repeat protein [Spirulina sp. 06S082]MEA5469755.1 tetratricopeptide repeat protein [Spirulina sp. 06S082]
MKVNPIFAVLLSASMLAMPQIAVADSVEVVQESAIERLFERGIAAQNAGNYAEAEAIWRQVIRRDRDNFVAYNNLGIALSDQGKVEEAIEASQEAIRLNPNYAFAYNNLGNALRNQGKLEEAIEAYQQALRLNPNYATAYYNLGIALRNQGKLEEAIEAYQQALRLNPNDATAYYNVWVTLSDQGKLEEAIEAYQQAIRLNPNYAAYNNLGNMLRNQGKLEEAIEAYQEAIRLNPNYATAYHNLGNVLYDQGKLEEALAKCNQALKLPEQTNITPASAHTLARNCLGLIYQKQEQYEEAIAEFQKAINLDSNWQIPRNNLRETQRLLALKLNPQPTYINDIAWLPNNDPDVPLLRSVVRVIAATPDGSQTGTGWVIKREGNRIWVLTARHVIHHEDTRRISDKIAVDFYSEPPSDKVHRRQEAKLVKIPIENDLDLVLLEVTDPPEDIQALPVLSQQVNRSDRIRIIGHPATGLPWTMVSGEISNRDRQLLQIAQTTVAAGNSGGPVLNEQDQVVGIVIKVSNSSDRETAGFAFAYSLTYVEVWLKKWEMF